jgi:O-methyltransferase involved in polyketide biosynthesis
MSSAPTAKADGTVLTGVSETALLTLRVRANEARRPDSIIDDPIAIELADAIDYDFAKFGFSRHQDMAVRALAYDRNTRRYLVDHPKAHRGRARRGSANQLLPARRCRRR